jgi:hypothetical protein
MERSSNDIKDDIDYEKEERAIERGNYQENSGTFPENLVVSVHFEGCSSAHF